MLRNLSVVLFAASALPALSQEDGFPAVFDQPYLGTASFDVFPYGGGDALLRDSGTAEAIFISTEDGTIILSGIAETPENGGVSFETVLDTPTDTGWRGFTERGMSELTHEGRFLSVGITDGYLHTLWGEASEETLTLFLRRTPTGAVLDTEEGEYEIVFSFDMKLGHDADAAEPATDSDERSDCARIISQTRVIANPYGGAMSMIMVPVCVPG